MALGRSIRLYLLQTTDQVGLSDRSTIDQARGRTAQPPLNYRPSTAQVQKLILSMNEEYMTMSELMECVGLKHRTTFRENYLLPAIEDNAIGLLYPDVPNHPKQKYYLTEKAKAWKGKNGNN